MNIKDLKLKYSNRVILIFEQVTRKTFELKSNTDFLIFFYCVIIANNREMNLSFEQFVEMTDDPETLPYLNEWFVTEMKKRQPLVQEEGTVVDEGKK